MQQDPNLLDVGSSAGVEMQSRPSGVPSGASLELQGTAQQKRGRGALERSRLQRKKRQQAELNALDAAPTWELAKVAQRRDKHHSEALLRVFKKPAYTLPVSKGGWRGAGGSRALKERLDRLHKAGIYPRELEDFSLVYYDG
jgi:hypothetical protein